MSYWVDGSLVMVDGWRRIYTQYSWTTKWGWGGGWMHVIYNQIDWMWGIWSSLVFHIKCSVFQILVYDVRTMIKYSHRFQFEFNCEFFCLFVCFFLQTIEIRYHSLFHCCLVFGNKSEKNVWKTQSYLGHILESQLLNLMNVSQSNVHVKFIRVRIVYWYIYKNVRCVSV